MRPFKFVPEMNKFAIPSTTVQNILIKLQYLWRAFSETDDHRWYAQRDKGMPCTYMPGCVWPRVLAGNGRGAMGGSLVSGY
jgi:hypothetical protein